MPFVGVAAGLRDAIRSILNHSFSPHLASTGIHCLVGEVPLAMRNHVFVAATFGGRGADEYQELDETEADRMVTWHLFLDKKVHQSGTHPVGEIMQIKTRLVGC